MVELIAAEARLDVLQGMKLVGHDDLWMRVEQGADECRSASAGADEQAESRHAGEETAIP
jgi:hypothetical protein